MKSILKMRYLLFAFCIASVTILLNRMFNNVLQNYNEPEVVKMIELSKQLSSSQTNEKNNEGLNDTLHSGNYLNQWKKMETLHQSSEPDPENLIYFGSNEKYSSIFNTEDMIRQYTKKDDNKLVKRFPRLIIIGAQKCGTAALRTFLSYHPSLVTTYVSEPNFFSGEKLDYTSYLRLMEYSEKTQISFEKSPIYFRKDTAVENIKSFDPDMKLILTVRHPIFRLVSAYHQFGKGDTFVKYIFERGKYDDVSYPMRSTFYDEHILRWLRYFQLGTELHIVNGDNLITNPVKELQKIESFLQIKPFFTTTNLKFNRLKGFYCFYEKSKTLCLGSSKGRTKSYLDLERAVEDCLTANDNTTEILLKLKNILKPHNENFYEMIGQRFDWD